MATRAPSIRERGAANAVLALCSAIISSAPAVAQTDVPVLDEIIVTAQKRPEGLADVPVSVSVMLGDRLDDTAIGRLEELDDYVPNFVMAETALGTNVFIRGIGSGVNQGFEQSVGMYVDGVYHGRAQLARLPFFDLERVEVLRGPQSTLFGKNSIAGALSFVTAQPTTELTARASMHHDPEHDETEVDGAVSGPLTDRMRGRAAFRGLDSDGYTDNVLLARSEPQREERALRLVLGWDVGDAATITVKAETATFDVLGRQFEITADRPAAAGPFAGLTYGQILAGVLGQPAAVLDHSLDYRRGSNGDHSNNDVDDAAITIEWSLGDLRFTSLTGYSAYDYDELCDCDITAANVFSGVLREDFDQVSEELRLASDLGGRIEYIAGLYFESNELSFFDSLLIDGGSVLVPLVNANPALPRPPFPPLPGTVLLANTAAPRTFTQDADVAAVFGAATWNVSDRFRLNFGGRFTSEKKQAARVFSITKIDGTPIDVTLRALTTVLYNELFNATPHSLAGERDKQKFVPSLRFEWDATDTVLTYVSITNGFKSGGFDARSNNPPVNPLFPSSIGSFEFQDEETVSVELGTKIRFGSGRGEVYAAVYDTDYEDLQVSTFDGTLGFNVGNAGSADVRGLEIEARYLVNDRLSLSGGIGLTDFEYGEFYGQCYFGRPPDAPDGINCDYRGKTNEYVADWNGSVSTDWRIPLGDSLALRWTVDVLFTDDYYLSPTLQPLAIQDGYVKLNSRLSIGRDDGRWEVAVLGKNLTDEATLRYGNETPIAGTTFGAPGLWGFVDAPRTVAIQGVFRLD